MKPVIKKETVYSVLLMRDDCGVRRFRLRAFWLKFLFCFLALVFAAAGAGGYLAYNYKKKYNDLQDERRDLEQQLAETRRRLEPLIYLEKIQEVSQNRFAAAGIGVASGTGPAGAAGINGVSSVSPGYSGAGDASMSAANQTRRAASIMPVAPPANATTPGAAFGGAGLATAAGNQTRPAAVVGNATAAAAPYDGHPAKITNMSLRASGNTRIRMSFDLNNQDPQLLLNGRVTLAVITNAGATAEITQVDRADLSFRINNYKKVSTTFALPSNLAVTDVASVLITLSGDNVPRSTERFPLQNP